MHFLNGNILRVIKQANTLWKGNQRRKVSSYKGNEKCSLIIKNITKKWCDPFVY